MKRPSSSSSAPSKKQKTSPRVSESEIVPSEGVPVDAQWVKVEKRKSKKQKKLDAKLDVCVSISLPVRIPRLTFHPRLSHLDSCILITRLRSVEILLASTYGHLTSFLVSAYYFNQDVRDLVLHVIADAPPPSWIRLQVSRPCSTSRLSRSHLPRTHKASKN